MALIIESEQDSRILVIHVWDGSRRCKKLHCLIKLPGAANYLINSACDSSLSMIGLWGKTRGRRRNLSKYLAKDTITFKLAQSCFHNISSDSSTSNYTKTQENKM
jgi:hypothetical protein